MLSNVPEVVTALVGVLRASVPVGFDLAPEQRAVEQLGVTTPCGSAMSILYFLLSCGTNDAAGVTPDTVLRRGEESAVLARSAVALLRAAPAASGGALRALAAYTLSPCNIILRLLFRSGTPAAAAAADPALAPVFSALDAAATALAGVVTAGCRALAAAAAAGTAGGASLEDNVAVVAEPLACVLLSLQPAARATHAARPPITAATARAVLGAAAAAVALFPPGADRSHWAIRGAGGASMIMVRTGQAACRLLRVPGWCVPALACRREPGVSREPTSSC